MKRIALLAIILATVLTAVTAFAAAPAGTCVASRYNLAQDAGNSQIAFVLECTGSASDGTVAVKNLNDPALSVGLTKPYWQLGYYLYEVWTETPASGNPDAADLAITDETGMTLFSQANVISGSVSTKTEGTVDKYRQVSRYLKAAHTNQGTASATWKTYIKLAK